MTELTNLDNAKGIEVAEDVGERDNIEFARYLRNKYEYRDIYSFTLPGEKVNKTISTVVCVTRSNRVFVAFGQLIDGEWQASRFPAQMI